MPELPAVEGFRQYLYSTSLHQTVADIDVRDQMVLAEVTEPDLQHALIGRQLVDTHRHGKWLLADVDGGPEVSSTSPHPSRKARQGVCRYP